MASSPPLQPTVTDLISNLKTCFSSIDFQNVAKILMNREKDLLNKTHFLENENKNLNGLLREKDAQIGNLEKENNGLKDEVKKKQNEIGFFKEKKLEFDVRVSSLEKMCKELTGSRSFSEVIKAKCVVPESTRLPPPQGFVDKLELLDPKPKKEKESKILEIIEIADDDEDDDDDPGDRDLMKMSSSKRKRYVSDDDDHKCISILRRRNVSKEVTKDHKNASYADKIPKRTQPTSHLKSPFCDSDSDDEK